MRPAPHIVEHLETRLQRVLPGAQVIRTASLGPDKGWSVVNAEGERVASAYSQRESINKALDAAEVKRVNQ